MKPLDWVVMFGWLAFIVSYGLYRGRGSNSTSKYMLAGRTMPWYAMGLSIMATQASAITFISTTGQSYVDGMRFVQFYFGLPVAMVILSATVVPLFHRAKVYTAYEYLEQRFDAKTRALVSAIFLIQRGLGAGLSLYAPAIVLSVILGWSDHLTTVIMGGLVVIYTTMGGIKAVTWADVQQMMLILFALVVALVMAVHLLPPDISFFDAVHLAGAAGRLNAVNLNFDWSDRYNLWSGLIGGSFLALAYFGCDQSQVQRYLTGKSIAQSRLSLLFNAMAKIPMQCFILFIGAMVFVLFHFQKPPILFHPVELRQAERAPEFGKVERRYDEAFSVREKAAREYLTERTPASADHYRNTQKQFEAARADGLKLAGARNDTNFIFLSFVTHYLPAGLVGLIVAVIFSAAMSSTSGEINSLATVTVIDIYRRHIKPNAADTHYVTASRLATLFWGAFAVAFASFGRDFGALIEAVNLVGSLFYGGLLGVFVLAFFFKSVGGTAAFAAVLAGEAAIFAAALYTSVSFLWYNVIGCVVVVAAGLALSSMRRRFV
ncbi:MAG TPA: sodium:solute symporter [Bryobacteraceae bacterium]|jgi:Na+/proline symporter|nr:sodium:solute symporter [Bryobacteraceae bacterium]